MQGACGAASGCRHTPAAGTGPSGTKTNAKIQHSSNKTKKYAEIAQRLTKKIPAVQLPSARLQTVLSAIKQTWRHSKNIKVTLSGQDNWDNTHTGRMPSRKQVRTPPVATPFLLRSFQCPFTAVVLQFFDTHGKTAEQLQANGRTKYGFTAGEVMVEDEPFFLAVVQKIRIFAKG